MGLVVAMIVAGIAVAVAYPYGEARHRRERGGTRSYQVGTGGTAHIVFACHLEEGEMKTACECVHPVTALAVRDILNDALRRQRHRGEMPHLRYARALRGYNAMQRDQGEDVVAAWAEEVIRREH